MTRRVLVGVVLLSIVVAGAAAAATGERERAATGTTVGGLDVSGQDRAALTDSLGRAAQEADAPLPVTLGDRGAELPAGTTGLRLDVPATVDRVLDESLWTRLRRAVGDPVPRAVDPVLAVDERALDAAVRQLVSAAQVDASPADLQYADEVISLGPARPGQDVTAAAVEGALRAHAADLAAEGPLAVPVVQRSPAPVDDDALAAVASRAREVLDSGLVLRADDRTRELRPAELGPELTVVSADGGARLGLRPSAEAQLAGVARDLSTPDVAPQIAAPPPTPLLEEKLDVRWRPRPVDAQMTDAGRPARTVTAAAVVAAVSPALAADADPPRTVEVPSVAVAGTGEGRLAPVDAVLGTFTTRFTCCEPRVTNIALIARTVDGTVVRPGETFSLNGLVGRRTLAKGYVVAPFISGGQLSTDVGGGVSQFATTMFNAVFFAGLQLDEHKAHSFYISRYPPGREATVNYPEIDLSWTNDTDSPVLVRTATDATSVTVAVYGRDDGRTVSGVTDARDEDPRGGFTARVRRTVQLPDQQARVDTFTTRYNPAPR